jgi:uncharacterized membrane-anchored protein
MKRRMVTVAVVAVLQLVIVGVAVAPRLSAYTRGEEYLLRVAPVDPIDPFRGAYVDLTYPDLQPGNGRRADRPTGGTTFVRLVPDGDYWVAAGYETDRPTEGPYLTCDSDGFDVSCGIESWFTDQDEARRLEAEVADGAVATVRIDGRGNAAIIALDAAPE